MVENHGRKSTADERGGGERVVAVVVGKLSGRIHRH